MNITKNTENTKETHQFQAEITQLMHLIVNAFYSKKEIFLRELISNSSDALDKVRYLSLTDPEYLEDETDLFINIIPNKGNNTLTIHDSGIGMTKQDLIDNLGTVAKSGTKLFMDKLKESGDMNLIGKFGVGFYSSFLVAKSVTVLSKHPKEDKIYEWVSSADGIFEINEYSSDNSTLKRGTQIILTLMDDMGEYLEEKKLTEIVNTHSSYTNYPINLYVEKTREVEEVSDVIDADDDKPTIEEIDINTGDEKVPPKETKMETYNEYLHLNTQKPIWTRPKKEVTEDEYKDFFGSINREKDYLAHKHFNVEGRYNFGGILYIPKNAPDDMFQKSDMINNIKLHVRRVFITDECKNLVPDYLTFVTGVIDSNDLPLNVSREMLQENDVIAVINKQIIKKVLEMLNELMDSGEDKYLQFYNEYRKNIKLGVYSDSKNRDKLIKYLRFNSIENRKEPISLEQYIKNMKETQKDIYYLVGSDADSIEDSPFLEALVQKGYDVMLMVDPIDEYVMQHIKEYQDHKLVCISKDGFTLEDKKNDGEQNDNKKDDTTNVNNEQYQEICKFIQSTLSDKIEKVVISTTLVNSPCALTTGQYKWTANMERLMKSQTLSSNHPMSQFMVGKKIMQLNPTHNLVNYLKEQLDNNNGENEITKLFVHMLYNTALLTSGFTIDNPHIYAKNVYDILQMGFIRDKVNQPKIENENTDEFAAKNTDEFADMPELENADMPELENADMPELENADIPELENADMPELENADMPELKKNN
jgi:molecular chaperone HtpG